MVMEWISNSSKDHGKEQFLCFMCKKSLRIDRVILAA